MAMSIAQWQDFINENYRRGFKGLRQNADFKVAQAQRGMLSDEEFRDFERKQALEAEARMAPIIYQRKAQEADAAAVQKYIEENTLPVEEFRKYAMAKAAVLNDDVDKALKKHKDPNLA